MIHVMCLSSDYIDLINCRHKGTCCVVRFRIHVAFMSADHTLFRICAPCFLVSSHLTWSSFHTYINRRYCCLWWSNI